MLDKGPSAGDACLKVGLLQVFTWRPSVPWQGSRSALISSQVTSCSPVPSEPGAQGPKSTQPTLLSHSSESTGALWGHRDHPIPAPEPFTDAQPGAPAQLFPQLRWSSLLLSRGQLHLGSVSPPHLGLLRPPIPRPCPPHPPAPQRLHQDPGCHVLVPLFVYLSPDYPLGGKLQAGRV